MLPNSLTVMRACFVMVMLMVAVADAAGQQGHKIGLANRITREGKSLTTNRQRPKVVRSIVPAYPAIAAAKRISGTVLVDVDINASGKVIEARPIIGDRFLQNSAVKAALRWEFNAEPDAAVRSVRLTFIFHDVSYVAPKKKQEFTSSYQVEIERMTAH